MARSDSFQKKWAAVPSQFERPSDELIDRGWAGGAAEDPPEAKWENWWHNRVDEALAEIEKNGAMQWFADVPYAIGASARSGGQNYIAALPSAGIQPGSAADVGHWIKLRVDTSGVVTTIDASATLSSQQLGLVLISAASASVTCTLPDASAIGVREVVLRRVDVTSNALVIAASGTDKLMLDTTAQAAGQAATELLFAGDYLRLRSDGAGKWWCVGQAQLPSSIASGLVSYVTPGAQSFTVPAVLRSGRRRALVTVIGGGGGGGAASSSANYNAAGGGGGGGGYAEKLVDLTGVSSVSVTVGAGGQGGVAPSTNATQGGTSSFGAYASATGGLPGNNANAISSSSQIGSGGQGGSGTGGDLNGRGHAGQAGASASPAVSGGSAGPGYGGGTAVSGGEVLGGGGNGAATTAGNQSINGNAGSAGAVIIRW